MENFFLPSFRLIMKKRCMSTLLSTSSVHLVVIWVCSWVEVSLESSTTWSQSYLIHVTIVKGILNNEMQLKICKYFIGELGGMYGYLEILSE